VSKLATPLIVYYLKCENMSDIIEDQKIHYIVKDYRRMFNNFWALAESNQVLRETIMEKDKEILLLRAKVNELKKERSKQEQLPKSKLKGILNDVESMAKSMQVKLQQAVSHAAMISNNVEEFRELINV
jgi:chromosome segregation ATPase